MAIVRLQYGVVRGGSLLVVRLSRVEGLERYPLHGQMRDPRHTIPYIVWLAQNERDHHFSNRWDTKGRNANDC